MQRRIRRPQYRQIRSPEAALALPPQQETGKISRQRQRLLLEIADYGRKAEDAKEILDIYLDSVEDVVLSELRKEKSEEELLRLQMYYRACHQLADDLSRMVREGKLKASVLRAAEKERGEHE